MLAIEYLGKRLENPFVLASAPPTAGAAMLRRAFEMGWAGAVIKTLVREPVSNVCNRFAVLRLGGHIMAFENFELVSERPPEDWFGDIRRLKQEFPDKIVVSSIMGDARNPAAWIELALGSQEAGADFLELNFSCPHGYPELGCGAAIGQNAEFTARIVRWLKSDVRLHLPIIPKLTAAVADIRQIGAAAAAAGADGLSAINTVPAFMGFDLKTLKPRAAVGDYSTTGGYSGPGIKPLALRAIAELARTPGLPLMAGGGVSSGFDAAEFMLLGAPVIQVGTAVMLEGYGLITRLCRELSEFMDEHRFAQPGDFLGLGLGRIKSHAELDRSLVLKARVDHERCAGCARCSRSCADAGYQAITVSDRRAQVSPERCSGCSLCVHVCPEGAISLTVP